VSSQETTHRKFVCQIEQTVFVEGVTLGHDRILTQPIRRRIVQVRACSQRRERATRQIMLLVTTAQEQRAIAAVIRRTDGSHPEPPECLSERGWVRREER
jgi:hypothetical protein